MFGGSVEDLSLSCWSVGWWSTCCWIGGRLSVVGCLSVIRGFVICQFTYAAILCANFNK